MRVKTSELSGDALDWAVAKCEGATTEWRNDGPFLWDFHPAIRAADHDVSYRPSTYWGDGGSIIEREKLCVTVDHSSVWIAYSEQNYADEKRFMCAGDTPLVAAMRCYVASQLGVEVDVPDELV